MSRRDSAASSRSSSKSGAGRGAAGPRVRSDGKVDIFCPQCGAQYRVPEDMLEEKMKCKDCERTFFPKANAGKRARPQDNTKVYVGFGIAALAIIVIFVVSSGGGKAEPVRKPVVIADTGPKGGMDARAEAVVKWAQKAGAGDVFGIQQYTDYGSVHKQLGVFPDKDYKNISGKERDDFDLAIIAAFQNHDDARWFRELDFSSGHVVDAATSDAGGKIMLFGTPKPGDDNYIKNTRAEIEVAFRMDAGNPKVTGWETKHKPARNPSKPDPNRKGSFVPNSDIAKAKMEEVKEADGSTTKTLVSEPGPVPHWREAPEDMRKKVDQIVADILESANPEAPGGAFNRATGQIKFNDLPLKKAAVARILNAMYELYGDVNGNNMKLSQLNKALVGITGFSVPYEVRDSGDSAKDRERRQTCIKRWFGFWWRYSSGDLSEFFDMRENPEEPLDLPDPGQSDASKKK